MSALCPDCGMDIEADWFTDRCPSCHKAFTDELKKTLAKEKIDRIIPAHFRDIETDHRAEFNRGLGKSLYITGKFGTGKSVFLYSMAKFLILNGEDIKIIRFPSWCMEMQASFRVDSENPFINAQRVAGFKGTLFIDDLGAEKMTEYIRQLIYFILDEREQNNLVTVITSNLSLKEIDELIDPRASSRIAGMCEVLIFKGEDRRIKKQAKQTG